MKTTTPITTNTDRQDNSAPVATIFLLVIGGVFASFAWGAAMILMSTHTESVERPSVSAPPDTQWKTAAENWQRTAEKWEKTAQNWEKNSNRFEAAAQDAQDIARRCIEAKKVGRK